MWLSQSLPPIFLISFSQMISNSSCQVYNFLPSLSLSPIRHISLAFSFSFYITFFLAVHTSSRSLLVNHTLLTSVASIHTLFLSIPCLTHSLLLFSPTFSLSRTLTLSKAESHSTHWETFNCNPIKYLKLKKLQQFFFTKSPIISTMQTH